MEGAGASGRIDPADRGGSGGASEEEPPPPKKSFRAMCVATAMEMGEGDGRGGVGEGRLRGGERKVLSPTTSISFESRLQAAEMENQRFV